MMERESISGDMPSLPEVSTPRPHGLTDAIAEETHEALKSLSRSIPLKDILYPSSEDFKNPRLEKWWRFYSQLDVHTQPVLFSALRMVYEPLYLCFSREPAVYDFFHIKKSDLDIMRQIGPKRARFILIAIHGRPKN